LKQLTKPEILEGEQVVNVQLTNQNIKDIHEALVDYSRNKKQEESTTIRIKTLLDEFKPVHKLMNPS